MATSQKRQFSGHLFIPPVTAAKWVSCTKILQWSFYFIKHGLPSPIYTYKFCMQSDLPIQIQTKNYGQHLHGAAFFSL